MLETSDEQLTNVERDKKFILAVATTDEASSDDAHRTWRKSDGGVCYTHADGDAEVMAGRGTSSPSPSARSARCSASWSG